MTRPRPIRALRRALPGAALACALLGALPALAGPVLLADLAPAPRLAPPEAPPAPEPVLAAAPAPSSPDAATPPEPPAEDLQSIQAQLEEVKAALERSQKDNQRIFILLFLAIIILIANIILQQRRK